MILSGDIGGTHSRLALYEVENQALKLVKQQTFWSKEHASLEEVLLKFADKERSQVTAASFGVPGPVVNDTVVTSNLPWVVTGSNLNRSLGTKQVYLLNDLQAAAWGINELKGSDLSEVKAGTEALEGNRALISPGTGLGEAFLIWDGQKYKACSSEGGHTDFSATNDIEIELYRFLRKKLKRVSWERLLSGPGLINIYQFIRSQDSMAESPELEEALKLENASYSIVEAAIKKQSESCMKAVNLFSELLGKEAGNLALKVLATGGVYIGGGIAPGILEFLNTSHFSEAFSVKGRLSPVLERIPVRVVLRNDTGLLGAARFAFTHSS